jgi:hypothetical protein
MCLKDADISPWSTDFSHGGVNVRFVVEKLTLGDIFSPPINTRKMKLSCNEEGVKFPAVCRIRSRLKIFYTIDLVLTYLRTIDLVLTYLRTYQSMVI